MTLTRRTLLALSSMAGLSGCSAVSAVSKASDPLDTYTLSPLLPEQRRSDGVGHLVVELPTSGGELSTDRILIKISTRQAEYLPDARWSEPTPAMVQSLLVNSLLNRGGMRLVTRTGAGLAPDHTLMSELQAFQAELVDPNQPGIHISLQMTLIRETDRSILGARRFGATVATTSDDSLVLIAGLDEAMQAVLADIVGWVETMT